MYLKNNKEVVLYRDNGGSNAGHTVEIDNVRIALHQIGSGIMQKGCTVILGKEMVLHPEDLVSEIMEVKSVSHRGILPAKLIIDEMAFLCLDTHRAFESVFKKRASGGKGSTGRGISPAHADILYRNPLRIRDLMSKTWKSKITKHYLLYKDWIKGMGNDIRLINISRLNTPPVKIKSINSFINRLEKARKELKQYVKPVYLYIKRIWQSQIPVVFEKAQAIGLDRRWGVYPDITVSNCGFSGIYSSTEGLVDPEIIAVKALTIKATYSSSVGTRKLPTLIKTKLADKIRKDANEYGATTKRPRDITYIDLPLLSYLFKVSKAKYLVMTHLDISYPNTPIKVCIGYFIKNKEVDYRPDQEYLNKVKPKYIELPSWNGKDLIDIRKFSKLPKQALQYISFITRSLGAELFMVTTGPKRNQTIKRF